MTKIEEAILKLDAKLKGVPFDFAFLFNGRETLVEEIAACPKLRKGLAAKFKEYLASRDLEDAIEGFVQTEDNPESRKEAILKRFNAVSALDS